MKIKGNQDDVSGNMALRFVFKYEIHLFINYYNALSLHAIVDICLRLYNRSFRIIS